MWPWGRKNKPKQFFPLIGDQPLVVETYNRFRQNYAVEQIYFSVTAELLRPLQKLFPKLPAQQFIVEPSRRDTAPAMGFAAAMLLSRGPNEPMVFVPADHFILDAKKYLDCFKAGEVLIKETSKLVDIGIAATFPSTVLGYTKIGKKVGAKNGVAVYHFAGHTEKPDLATAKRYLRQGGYLWHGNYYMWTPARFLEAFKKFSPGHYKILARIIEALNNKRGREVPELYNKMAKISFDYAITEKLKPADVLILKGEFGWSDVGAWDLLHDRLKVQDDEFGNATRGTVIAVDSKHSVLFSAEKKILAAVGLKDFIVINTPDAILVCPKNRAQDVKMVIKQIEEQGLEKFL